MVPNGWEIKTVGQLFEVQLGKMLNKAAKEKYPQYPYLGNSDVRWGYVDTSQLKEMYFSEKEMNKFTLLQGDILLCEGGEVGRCAIWQDENTRIFYQKALHRLRSLGSIIPEYFQLYMVFINGTKLLDDFTTKTSIAHLTREKLIELPIKAPPLPEQRKIAKILSTWDKAIATNEKLIEASKQQKKALMQQLLTGKKRLVNPETGELFESEWNKVTVGSIANLTAGGTPNTKHPEYWGGDIPWMNSGEINLKQVFSVDGRITELGLKKSSTKEIPENSVLVALAGQGKTRGTVAINKINLCTNQSIAAIIPEKTKVSPEFLYFNLDSRYKELRTMSTGDGGRGGLNLSILKSIKLAIPALEEQKKIASLLTAADKEIEVLEAKLAHFKQEKKALMQQLLTGKRRVKVDEVA